MRNVYGPLVWLSTAVIVAVSDPPKDSIRLGLYVFFGVLLLLLVVIGNVSRMKNMLAPEKK